MTAAELQKTPRICVIQRGAFSVVEMDPYFVKIRSELGRLFYIKYITPLNSYNSIAFLISKHLATFVCFKFFEKS